MRTRALPGLVVLALGGLAVYGGACEPVPLGHGPRRAAFQALSDEVIGSALADTAREAGALAAVLAGTGTAAADLGPARDQWRRARAAFKRAEPLALVPLASLRVAARMDQSPVDPARVDELVRTATLTSATIAALGANRVGFHALEALVFAPDAEARWNAEPRRARLAVLLGEALAADAQALTAAWAAGEAAGEAARWTDVGTADAAFATVGDAVDAVVNALITHVERMLIARLGPPLGHDAGGEPDPSLEESPLSDASVDDLLENLAGVEVAYRVGLGPLVRARSAELDARVMAALVAARAALVAIPRPLAAALGARASEPEAAYAALDAVRVILRTEVVGALGAVLKLNDNDGD